MAAIIFDLDGTLWDTCESCAIAWNKVLSGLEIDHRAVRAQDIRAVAGKPHAECIDRVFSSLAPEIRKIICDQTMLEDNRVVSELGGQVYPGVLQGLETLKQHYGLAIVSNCQSGYIETFLEFINGKNLFTDVECWGNTGNGKGKNLAALVRRNDFDNFVYVGDTQGDMDAATYCDIPFIQVTYGFGMPITNATKAESFNHLIALLDDRAAYA